MDDQQDSNQPSQYSDEQRILPAPVKSAMAKTEISEDTENESKSDKATTRKLRREFRWFEIASLVVNACLALLVLRIYSGQLKVMQGQLDQMKGSSTQSDRLISETHTLANNAGAQATNAADQAKKLAELVQATNKQASVAREQLSVMHRQLELVDRPWISVEPALSNGLRFDQSGKILLEIKYRLQNTGRSTATDVVTSLVVKTMASLPIEMGNWDEPLREQASNCAHLQNRQLPDGGQIREGSSWWTITPKVALQATYPRIPSLIVEQYKNRLC